MTRLSGYVGREGVVKLGLTSVVVGKRKDRITVMYTRHRCGAAPPARTLCVHH